MMEFLATNFILPTIIVSIIVFGGRGWLMVHEHKTGGLGCCDGSCGGGGGGGPGMTSSSILMAVGLLTPLIDGIAQLDFTVLVPWGLGMVGVMALFARIVSRLFDTHYSIACHAVIGIVLASTLIIIPTGFASTAEMVWSVACCILVAVRAYFCIKLQPQVDEESEAK